MRARVVLVLLGLLPRLAAGAGSVGPLERVQSFPGFRGTEVKEIVRAGDLVFFTVQGIYVPQTLWRSDGTDPGTFALDITLGLRFWTVQGSRVFYTRPSSQAADDPHRNLWRSDGSQAGTIALTQGLSLAVDASAGDAPTSLSVPETGLVFFSAGAEAAQPDSELWVTDGTPAGTRLVKDVNPEGASNPSHMTAFGGQLFFLADTPEGPELWRSDGTPEGTEEVESLHHVGDGKVALEQAGDSLFLAAETDADVELWRSDGTSAGTFLMLRILSSRLAGYAAASRRFFVAAGNPDTEAKEIWAADGDPASRAFPTRVLAAPAPGPLPLFAYGDGVLFALSEAGFGLEPWRSDGTAEGTRRIADLCPGPCSSSPKYFGTYRGLAVFLADGGVLGREPWLTDGTGTQAMADLCPGSCSSPVEKIEEVNGWLLLASGSEAWISDGTGIGTFKVAQFLAGSTSALFLPLGDRVVVATVTHAVGFQLGELWTLPVTAPLPPPPPAAAWFESPGVPGFRFLLRIEGEALVRQVPACPAGTLCIGGVQPGRSEVFLRMSPSNPEGRLWPSVVKLTTAAAEVWALQTATCHLRHYRLEATAPTGSILDGLLDRDGFKALDAAAEEARAAMPSKSPQPPGRWIESKTVPGFRVQARLTSGGKSQLLRREACTPETFCLSGSQPGRTDLLVRVPGLQPRIARFTPARLEVWIQQTKTGTVRYYRLEASSDLDGLVDRQGFQR